MIERTMECENCGNKKTVEVAPEGKGCPRESYELKRKADDNEGCCDQPKYEYL